MIPTNANPLPKGHQASTQQHCTSALRRLLESRLHTLCSSRSLSTSTLRSNSGEEILHSLNHGLEAMKEGHPLHCTLPSSSSALALGCILRVRETTRTVRSNRTNMQPCAQKCKETQIATIRRGYFRRCSLPCDTGTMYARLSQRASMSSRAWQLLQQQGEARRAKGRLSERSELFGSTA